MKGAMSCESYKITLPRIKIKLLAVVCPQCKSEIEINWRTDWQKYQFHDIGGGIDDFFCPVCDKKIQVSHTCVPAEFKKRIFGDLQY